MAPSEPDMNMLLECAEIIKNGGLVAFPTETVYGLGANGLDSDACKKIYSVKNRPYDKGLILHLSQNTNPGQFAYLNDYYQKLSKVFFGCPLTYVLKKKPVVPDEVSCSSTVAFRCPPNPIAVDFLKLCGLPVAAPSANISGQPAPKCADDVIDAFDGKIDAIIDAGMCGGGIPSTIISLADKPFIIRIGAISEKEVLECLNGML